MPDTARAKTVIIGADGLRPDNLEAVRTPHIDALTGAGFYTRGCNSWESAKKPFCGHSAPNWATLLTGVNPDRHGLQTNADLGKNHFIDDDLRNPAAGDKVPTVFGRLKARDPARQTAAIYTWGGIGTQPGGILEYSGRAVDHAYCATEGAHKCERDLKNVELAVSLLRDGVPVDPDLLFIHLDGTDMHTTILDEEGKPAPLVVERITALDRMVGDMAAAIHARPTALEEDWLIVFLSDHGCDNDGGHVDNSDPLVRTVPYVFSGPSVPRSAPSGALHLRHLAARVLRHLVRPSRRAS